MQQVTDLGDFAEATRVNGPILGDGHRVPALVLGLTVAATPCRVGSTTASPAAATAPQVLLLGHERLHFNMLAVLLQFSLLVDLVNGLGALVSSPGHPVVL